MNKLGRRTFLKVMGAASAIFGMGLSSKTWAQTSSGTISSTNTNKRSKRITVEEHISSQDYVEYLNTLEKSGQGQQPMQMQNMPIQGGNSPMQGGQGQTSTDVIGDIEHIDMRIKDMDENGIDMQVLSWRNPGVEEFDAKNGLIWARKINDKLAGVVNKYPKRFAAFSSIPWQDPTAAVTELERAVNGLGLKGIKMDGTVKGDYLDAKKYWPIYKKAEELGVPIFIHVEDPRTSMIKFYTEYSTQAGGIQFGRELDVCMEAVRLISSGLFDECPKLKFILGHMGEGLPFWSKRLGGAGGGGGGMKQQPGYYIKENFYVATSGNFYHPALMCCYQAVGAERILFAVDFPSESNKEAVEFMETAKIPESDKEKIYHSNAEELFNI